MCRATAVRRWEIDLRGQNHTSTHLLDQHAGGHQTLPIRRQHRQHWQHQQPWAAQLSSSLTSGEQRGRDLPALLCLELLQVGKSQTNQNQLWWKITVLSIVLKTNRSCCSGTAREHKRKGIVWKSEAILNQKCNVNRSSSPWSSSAAEESRNVGSAKGEAAKCRVCSSTSRVISRFYTCDIKPIYYWNNFLQTVIS